jgi:hypothetical protein
VAKWDKLSKTFEEGKNQDKAKDTKFDQLDVIQKSIAIVKTVDKLKAQGISVTKKAEMDYLLALRVLEKNNIDILEYPHKPAEKPNVTTTEPVSPSSPSEAPVKRNPQDHPEEFKIALEFSRKTVAEVEALLKQEKPVPVEKMESYELSKKFLKKYT